MEDNFITYKFWKKGKGIAIYISECGGIATISQKGMFFPKLKATDCPAMKARSIHAYPLYTIAHFRSNSRNYHFYIHRAVAEVYLHPKNLLEIEVDHLDGNIDNYHVLNLEWVTHEENIRRAVEMRRRRKGASAHTDKRTKNKPAVTSRGGETLPQSVAQTAKDFRREKTGTKTRNKKRETRNEKGGVAK